MIDILVRFLIGGFIVSVFSVISDLFKPKTFAGLFSAAPSVALATLGLTVMKEGKQYAAVEARSMIIGAIALFAYAVVVGYVLLRYKFSVARATLTLLILWLGVATGLWFVMTG